MITSSNMERMERILAEGPRFHRADTEVEDQTFSRSLLPKTQKMRMQNLKSRQFTGSRRHLLAILSRQLRRV